MGILKSQFLHFAFRKKYEKIGMLSYHTTLLLHCGQKDLPKTILLLIGRRYIQTLAKLPQSAPRIMINKMSTKIIF